MQPIDLQVQGKSSNLQNQSELHTWSLQALVNVKSVRSSMSNARKDPFPASQKGVHRARPPRIHHDPSIRDDRRRLWDDLHPSTTLRTSSHLVEPSQTSIVSNRLPMSVRSPRGGAPTLRQTWFSLRRQLSCPESSLRFILFSRIYPVEHSLPTLRRRRSSLLLAINRSAAPKGYGREP